MIFLVAYVNNVPVGHLNGRALIGFSAAGEALFGKKDPKRLTLSEACTLAGMLNRPNGYLKEAAEGDHRRIVKKGAISFWIISGRANTDRYSDEAIERAKKEEIRFFKNKQAIGIPSPGNLLATPINSSRAGSRDCESISRWTQISSAPPKLRSAKN